RHPKLARSPSGSRASGFLPTPTKSRPAESFGTLRAEAERTHRGGGVDHSITQVVVPAAPGQIAGAALQCALELCGRERRRGEALAQRRGDARTREVAEAGEVRLAGVEPARSLRRIAEASIGDGDGGDGDDVGMGIR